MKAVLLLFFFLTGAAGLAYEVAWTRQMVFVLGNTNLAMGLVLALFLFGFFAGSLKGSRWGSSRAVLLRRYALLEAGIGIFGLLFPFLAGLSKEYYPVVAVWIDPDVARLLFCILLIGAPTFLMGATFPIMNGIFITKRDAAARGAGLIYGFQTLGAACGAALAGFFLLRHLGLEGTSQALAAVNALVAIGALCLSLLVKEGDSPRLMREPVVSASGSSDGFPVLYAVLFCTGAASLSLELLWTRILVFFVDGLTYSFTAMLVVYLLALAAGACLLALFARIIKPGYMTGGIVLVAGGLSAIACLLWIPSLYSVIQSIRGDLSLYDFNSFLLSIFAATGMILFIPALLIGMAPPLAIGILIRERGGACRESGLAYAVSCFGCCAGALAGSWLIVPYLGLKMGAVLAGLLVVMAGCFLIAYSRTHWFYRIVLGVASFFLAVFLTLDVQKLDDIIKYSHVFQRPGRLDTTVLEESIEDNVCTASVVHDKRNKEQRLYTDGFNAASTGSDYAYMRMMGHLPALACRNPARCLVICYGTGTTAGSLSLHAGVQEMEIVEISPAVMELASLFHAVNHGVGLETMGWKEGAEKSEPGKSIRVHTRVDGRDYLNLDREGFDLITLEPLMPYTPAAVHFYTAEFYRLCMERLKPGGVVCQWVPLNAVPGDDLKLLLGTFAASVPSSGFFHFGNCLLLLGFADSPWTLDAARVAAAFSQEAVKRDLDIAGCPDPQAVLGAFICDGKKMKSLTAAIEPMTDDRTTVEYVRIAPGAEAYARMADGFAFLSVALEPLGKHLAFSGSSDEEMDDLIDSMRVWLVSSGYVLKGLEAEAKQMYARYFPGKVRLDQNPEVLFERAFQINPSDSRARKYGISLIRKAESLMRAGQFAAARRTLDKAMIFTRGRYEYYRAEALLALANRRFTEVKEALDHMNQIKPYTKMGLAIGAVVERAEGKADRARISEERLESWGGLDPQEKDLFDRMATAGARADPSVQPLSLDQLLVLLKSGPDGRTGTGRRAWIVAGEASQEMLEQARLALMAEVAAGGESVGVAALGLGYFDLDEVRDLLRQAYLDCKIGDRPAVLHALFHAGDDETFLLVLASRSASPELLVKATEIATDAMNQDAVTPLIDLLAHQSARVRTGAILALFKLTGLQFDFNPCGKEEDRKASVARWRQWNEKRDLDPPGSDS